MSRTTDPSTARQRYGRRARTHRVTPLWEFFKDWFGAEPRVEAVPYLWRYAELRPLLAEAAEVVSAAEAERRVLALENPGLPGKRLATDALYAGLQLILPGEVAPAHRHSAAALRFVIESDGAYTSVSGERTIMRPGDFVVTPSWTWHEHGNDGNEPAVWMDVLDVPLVRFLGAGFSEHYADGPFPDRLPAGDSQLRFGANMRPAGYVRGSNASPMFSYPYERAREALEGLRASSRWDPHEALKMEYIDPTSGGPAIPTLSTFLQLLPAGFATRPYANTAGTVYCAVEGRGRATVGTGESAAGFDFLPRDIWSVPSWHPIEIEAQDDCVLFSASDRAVQVALGMWRERRD